MSGKEHTGGTTLEEQQKKYPDHEGKSAFTGECLFQSRLYSGCEPYILRDDLFALQFSIFR